MPGTQGPFLSGPSPDPCRRVRVMFPRSLWENSQGVQLR